VFKPRSLGFLVLTVLLGQPVSAELPSVDAIWQLIQQQQAEIETLKAKLQSQEQRLVEAADRLRTVSQTADQAASNQAEIAETRLMLESTVESVEAAVTTRSSTEMGGYGELHMNRTNQGDEIDFHRFVLFFNHAFSERLNFYSELEIEHSIAGEGQVGEVELEQAFIQWDYQAEQRAKMGLFLLPIGILNETHEPDTFYGVERNSIERNIIPATWWEAGVAFNGEISPGWGYDLAIHSGLNLLTGSESEPVGASRRSSLRSARQKVAEANADSLAYTARVSYSAIPGLQVRGAIQHQADITQGDDEGFGIDAIRANLFEVDINYSRDRVGLRALYARWMIDQGIERLNPGANRQLGWYLEPSYRLSPEVGFFARYGEYDLTAGQQATSDKRRQWDLGMNYWLHENVVLKFDLQRQDNETGKNRAGFNIGLGYSY